MQPITCEIRSLPPVFIMHLEDTGVLLLTRALPSSQERNSFQYSHLCVRSAHCTGLNDCKATCVPSADILKRTPTTAGARKVRSKLHECSSHMNPLSSAKTRDNQSTYIHDTVTLGGLGMSLAPQQRTSTVGQMARFLPLNDWSGKGTGFPTREGLGQAWHNPRAQWLPAIPTNPLAFPEALILSLHFSFSVLAYYFIMYFITSPSPDPCTCLTSLLFSSVPGCKCLRTGVVLPLSCVTHRSWPKHTLRAG